MQNIDSDLIRGNIDTIILKTMLNEDKYGLDIIKEVSDKSSGTYVLKQPTLYSCLKRLENQELISSYWVDSDIGGKRHYYKLTDKGREFYNKKQEEWAKSKFIIDNLLSNYNYEEYRLVKKDEYDEILQNKANASLYNTAVNAEELGVEESPVQDETEISTDDEELSDNLQEDDADDSQDTEDVAFEDETLDETHYSLDNEQEDFEPESEQNFDDSDVFSFSEDDDKVDDEEVPSNENDDDYPVYFSAKPSESFETQNNVSYETSDQSSNELNILSRLRDQEDETINTYYGDQKSYVNHLNQLDDSQLEQQDLLDSSLYVRPDEVNKMVDEFTSAIQNLNNFTCEPSEEIDNESDLEEAEFEEESFDFEEPQHTQTANHYVNEEFDDLDELNSLKNLSAGSFFDSYDHSSYNKKSEEYTVNHHLQNSYEPDHQAYEDESTDECSSMSFEEISHEITPEYNSIDTTEDTTPELCIEDYHEESNNMSDIDAIISNNITSSYAEPTYAFYRNQSNANYRNKLSDLTKYSRVNLEEPKPEIINETAIAKAKDISEITKELEEEGIKVKEHYKQLSDRKYDKHYLLSNKISLIKSLIMFFGYVFILSAVYIVLNNTSMKENSWFNIKPFLLGFIPYGALLLYNGIIFMLNPYKKVDYKFHFRIMFFISIIITIQLLLITYCLNLQLGFYSFTQQGYNHLYWIVPSILSVAPVIDNLVYLALFKSRNFNV